MELPQDVIGGAIRLSLGAFTTAADVADVWFLLALCERDQTEAARALAALGPDACRDQRICPTVAKLNQEPEECPFKKDVVSESKKRSLALVADDLVGLEGCDVRYRRIPNPFVLATLISGICMNVFLKSHLPVNGK